MRNLAFNTVKAAAEKCGLAPGAIFPELQDEGNEEIFLPARRLEVGCMDESLKYMGWRVGRLKSANPETVSCTRWANYECSLPVRVLVRGSDQDWLDSFCRDFLLALPHKITDSFGNRVKVSANRAVRRGYTYASIKIEEKCTQALHLRFDGILHRDVDGKWIKHLNINEKYEEASYGQK